MFLSNVQQPAAQSCQRILQDLVGVGFGLKASRHITGGSLTSVTVFPVVGERSQIIYCGESVIHLLVLVCCLLFIHVWGEFSNLCIQRNAFLATANATTGQINKIKIGMNFYGSVIIWKKP